MVMQHPVSACTPKGTVFLPGHGTLSMKMTAGSFAVTFTFNQLSTDQTVKPKCHRGVLAGTQLGFPLGSQEGKTEPLGGKKNKNKKKWLPVTHVAVKADSDSSWAIWRNHLEEKHPDLQSLAQRSLGMDENKVTHAPFRNSSCRSPAHLAISSQIFCINSYLV